MTAHRPCALVVGPLAAAASLALACTEPSAPLDDVPRRVHRPRRPVQSLRVDDIECGFSPQRLALHVAQSDVAALVGMVRAQCVIE